MTSCARGPADRGQQLKATFWAVSGHYQARGAAAWPELIPFPDVHRPYNPVMDRPPFSITVARVGDVAVVSVAGDLDLQTAPTLDHQTRPLFDVGGPVELDLARVSFIDSTGINTLVRLNRHATENNSEFTLVDPPPYVLRVLTVTGLTEAFHIRPTPDTAPTRDPDPRPHGRSRA